MAEQRTRKEDRRRELIQHLRKLLKWRNNDVVKLAFLDESQLDQVDGMDLSGVAELKRGANGTFEVKLIDRVKVLSMMRELLEEEKNGTLEELLDELRKPEDGDEK